MTEHAGAWIDRLPYHLAAAWIAAAPLYAADIGVLPSPAVCIGIASLVAVGAAVVPERGRPGRTGGEVAVARQPPRSPVAHRGADLQRATTATDTRVAPVIRCESDASAAPKAPVDLRRFRRARPFEAQCAHCGSFDLLAVDRDQGATCAVCGRTRPALAAAATSPATPTTTTTTTDQPSSPSHPPLPVPGVTVRSWLHR